MTRAVHVSMHVPVANLHEVADIIIIIYIIIIIIIIIYNYFNEVLLKISFEARFVNQNRSSNCFIQERKELHKYDACKRMQIIRLAAYLSIISL